MADAERFYGFVREERLFCATVAHLLWEDGPNLGRFLSLVNTRLPVEQQLAPSRLEESEVYIEFSFLRDHWDTLAPDNDAKRRTIFDRLSAVPELKRLQSSLFSPSIPEFNAYFMGERGWRISGDIVYPGQWSVGALAKADNPHLSAEEFRALCKFKWSFNIKPDLAILLPDAKPICVEAKLESREGWYPTALQECNIFDSRFGVGQGRVGQFGLQQFMFEFLLGQPCQPVIIGRDAPEKGGAPFLTWTEVFASLDMSRSHPFVRRLTTQNRHLGKQGAAP